jgi:hypothetical protein
MLRVRLLPALYKINFKERYDTIQKIRGGILRTKLPIVNIIFNENHLKAPNNLRKILYHTKCLPVLPYRVSVIFKF